MEAINDGNFTAKMTADGHLVLTMDDTGISPDVALMIDESFSMFVNDHVAVLLDSQEQIDMLRELTEDGSMVYVFQDYHEPTKESNLTWQNYVREHPDLLAYAVMDAERVRKSMTEDERYWSPVANDIWDAWNKLVAKYEQEQEDVDNGQEQ